MEECEKFYIKLTNLSHYVQEKYHSENLVFKQQRIFF